MDQLLRWHMGFSSGKSIVIDELCSLRLVSEMFCSGNYQPKIGHFAGFCPGPLALGLQRKGSVSRVLVSAVTLYIRVMIGRWCALVTAPSLATEALLI